MAAAVLQPPQSKMTSLAPEISKARQRRRRSTRRSEGLTRSPNLETQGTRLSQELGPSALADNVSTSDAASSVLDSTVGSVDSALTGEFYSCVQVCELKDLASRFWKNKQCSVPACTSLCVVILE